MAIDPERLAKIKSLFDPERLARIQNSVGGAPAQPQTPADPIDEAILSVGGDPAIVRSAKSFDPAAIMSAVAPVSQDLVQQPVVGASHNLAQKGLGIAQHGLRAAGKITQVTDALRHPQEINVDENGVGNQTRQQQPTDADLHFVEVLQKLGDKAYEDTKAPGAAAKFGRGVGMAGAEVLAGGVNPVGAARAVTAGAGGRLAAYAGRSAKELGAENVVRGAIAGGLAPDLAADVTSEEDSYGQNAGTNAALGGVIAGGVGGVLSGLTRGVSRVGNMGKDNAPGILPEEKNFLQGARQRGLEFRLGDAYPEKPFLRSVEDKVTTDKRAARIVNQATETANRILDEANNVTKGTRFDKLIGANNTRREEAAGLVGELRAARASRDPDKIIAASGKIERMNAELKSDREYERVADLAKNTTDVGNANYLAKLDEVLKVAEKNPDLLLDDNYYLKTLIKMRESIVRNPSIEANTAIDARKNLAPLGAKVAREMGAPVPTSVQHIFEDLRVARRKDIREAALASGNRDLERALTKADANYKTTVAAKESALATVLGKDLPFDQIYSKVMSVPTPEGGVEGTRILFNSLDKKGKAAVQERFFKTALDRAKADGGKVDVAKLDSYLTAMQRKTDIVFTGAAKHELDGLKNYVSHIKRVSGGSVGLNAGPAMERAMSAAAVAGTTGSTTALKGTGGIFALGGVGDTALNSKPMRDFWLAASDLKPGSKAMTDLVNRTTAKLAIHEYTKTKNPYRGAEQ